MFPSVTYVLLVAAVFLVSPSVSTANDVEPWQEGKDQCPWTGPNCIRDCIGRKDGYYQSCRGCTLYARCLAGKIQYFNCRKPYLWNDKLKRCRPISETCFCYQEPETCDSTGARCIRSCSGLPDGDYQSCHGCSVYASCVVGRLIDYRPCSFAKPPLQFDDGSKRCQASSTTCRCVRGSEGMDERLDWSRRILMK